MNIAKYLEQLISMNPSTKTTLLANRIMDDYPEFPYKKSSVKVLIRTVRRDEGHTIRGDREIDLEKFPLFRMDSISPLDAPSIDEITQDLDENPEEIALEEQQMKVENATPQYTYEDGMYLVGNKFTISGDIISKLFVDYPNKGLNLSRTAIINKYNLKEYSPDGGHRVLQTIQTKLGLYKDSNIVPPHLYDELSPEELEQYMEDQMDDLIVNPEYIEKKYTNRVLTQYRKVINEASLNKSMIKDAIQELTQQFKTINKTITLTSTEGHNGKNVVVTVADMHSGAKVKDVQRTHDFDTKIVEERLAVIADDLNGDGWGGVYLAIMGDVFQGSPYNHIGAGNTIEEQYAEQWKTAYFLLTDFIQNVNNLKGIYAIGGNHDRMSADNRMDQRASLLDTLMFAISRVIRDIPIQFHHDTLSFEVDDIRYILQHGHFNYHKKSSADIILDHGDQSKFNMILRAHLHSLQVLNNDDRRNYRRAVVPSIYTGEDYSSTGGWSNNAGFTKFTKSQFKNIEDKMLAPKMIVESLP